MDEPETKTTAPPAGTEGSIRKMPGSKTRHIWVRDWFSRLKIAIFLFTLGVIGRQLVAADCREFGLGLLLFWVLAPPMWFWYEFHGLWRRELASERGDFEEFKHSQEVSKSLWLAVVAVLAVVFLEKMPP